MPTNGVPHSSPSTKGVQAPLLHPHLNGLKSTSPLPKLNGRARAASPTITVPTGEDFLSSISTSSYDTFYPPSSSPSLTHPATSPLLSTRPSVAALTRSSHAHTFLSSITLHHSEDWDNTQPPPYNTKHLHYTQTAINDLAAAYSNTLPQVWLSQREKLQIATQFLTSIKLQNDELSPPPRPGSASRSVSPALSAITSPTLLSHRSSSPTITAFDYGQKAASSNDYYNPAYRIRKSSVVTTADVVDVLIAVTSDGIATVDVQPVGHPHIDTTNFKSPPSTALALLRSRSLPVVRRQSSNETEYTSGETSAHDHALEDIESAPIYRSTENDYLYDSDSRAHHDAADADVLDSQSITRRQSYLHDRRLYDHDEEGEEGSHMPDDDDRASVDTRTSANDDRSSVYSYRSYEPKLPQSVLIPTVLYAARRHRHKLRQRQQMQQLGLPASRFNQFDSDDSDNSTNSKRTSVQQPEFTVTTRNPSQQSTYAFERSINARGAANSRMYITSNAGDDAPERDTLYMPLISTTYISYAHEQRQRNSARTAASTSLEDTEAPLSLTGSMKRADTLRLKLLRQGRSYKHLLQPKPMTTAEDDAIEQYNPFYLDDPNIKSGRHRVVLNLPGYVSSIVSYVRHNELKDELNEKFRARHEWIDPSMSLSKIRKLKRLMLRIGQELDLELSTVALAYIYFERTCLKNIVNKRNRRVITACCMLLAYKYNEASKVVRLPSEAEQQNSVNSAYSLSSQNSLSSIDADDVDDKPASKGKSKKTKKLSAATSSTSSSNTSLTSTVTSLWRTLRGKPKKGQAALLTNKRRSAFDPNNHYQTGIRELLDTIEEVLDVKRQEVLRNEFTCLVALEMDLSVKSEWILTTFKYVLGQLEHVSDHQYLDIDWSL